MQNNREKRPCRVGEGLRRGNGLKFKKAVQDPGKGTPGDGGVRPEGAVLIAADDAVCLAPLVNGALRPMAGGIGKGGGYRRQRQCAGQGRGQDLFRQSNFFHGRSFLSVFVDLPLIKKHTAAQERAAVC